MRVLLDESVPRRLKRDLLEYGVATVTEMGWQGKLNGELLRLAEKRFDVLIISTMLNSRCHCEERSSLFPTRAGDCFAKTARNDI